MMSIRSAVLAIVAAIAIATPGHAAEWPTRLVRFVVPFTAGGATDVLTRLLCQRLSTELNVPFIVENRGGAGGNVGGAAVAGAPNDGYTFLMGAPGVLSYNKALYREMRFDPDRELEPVSLFARLPNVLVVNPKSRRGTSPSWSLTPRPIRTSSTMAPSARARPRFFPLSCSNRWPARTSSSCPTARPHCR